MSTSAEVVPTRPSRGRSIAAGVVGVIAVLVILVASVVGTMHAVVLSPDTLTSVVAPVAKGSIVGFGGHGYTMAIDAVAHLLGAVS